MKNKECFDCLSILKKQDFDNGYCHICGNTTDKEHKIIVELCYECSSVLTENDFDKGTCSVCGSITGEDYFEGEE
jgi:RNA polymerase subunit RPABC4/transcription elongation factor Spt4